jgi:hypothetical protein
MKFPYRRCYVDPSPTAPSGILYRPEMPLQIIGGAGAVDLCALVDPGSDDTLMPLNLGRKIGAVVDATQSWKMEGIGGQAVPVILGEVVLALTDGNQTFRWPAKVGLVDFADPKDEVVILGHAGFLDYFRVIFDGQMRALEIEVTPAFTGQVL